MERKMSGQLRWAVFLTGIASVLGAALVPALSPLDLPLASGA
jgi:hypothetical protein